MLNFVSGMICRYAIPAVVLRVHVQFVPTYQYRSDSLPPPPPLASRSCALARAHLVVRSRWGSSAS